MRTDIDALRAENAALLADLDDHRKPTSPQAVCVVLAMARGPEMTTDIDALLKEAAEHGTQDGLIVPICYACGRIYPCLVARLAEALREKTDADQAGR